MLHILKKITYMWSFYYSIMENLTTKTRDILIDRGYMPKDVQIAERGYQNRVVRAECEEEHFVVKWFTDSEETRTSSVGHRSNRFIGGWYVQTRLSDMLDIPLPEILHADFSNQEGYYYVMDNVEFEYADDLWSNDMFLMTLSQEIGRILSKIHSVGESDIGGIPGKRNDTMENMRHYMKTVENMISGTPYATCKNDLRSLKKRYERIFNPNTERLVHGDTTASNILTQESGIVVGIVDWEDSMYADPLIDIATFQAMVCDVFGVFSPWSIESLRESVVESYSRAVNHERLEILRAITHLWAGAKIDSEAMLSPWNRVASRSELTRQEIHRMRFESLSEDLL